MPLEYDSICCHSSNQRKRPFPRFTIGDQLYYYVVVAQLAQSIAEGAEEATGDDAHRDDVTALMVAAQGGHLEMVTLLMDKGADVAAKDEEGFTALLNAVKVCVSRCPHCTVGH